MRYIHCRMSQMLTLLLLLTVTASAQNEKLISGNFQGLSFGQFVHAVELQSDYHFYYNLSPADSFSINIQVTNKPLKSILEQIFRDTEFHFAIDRDNNV